MTAVAEKIVQHEIEEIREAVARLQCMLTEEYSADQYYLVLAIMELEKRAQSLTPAVVVLEEARRNLDAIFIWRDRSLDETKDEYRAAVDTLIAAAKATHSGEDHAE